MKKAILILLCFVSINIYGQSIFKPYFGASPYLLRAKTDKVINPYRSKEYGYFGNSESGILTNMKIDVEAMGMINNWYEDNPDSMDLPKFIRLQLLYNDFTGQSVSASYGQSMECFTSILGLWNIKGFYHAGIHLNFRESVSKAIKTGFSGYTKHYGLSSEIIYTPKNNEQKSDFSINAMLYRDLWYNFAAGIGVENNEPKTSLSYMQKHFSVNVSLQKIEGKAFFSLGGAIRI